MSSAPWSLQDLEKLITHRWGFRELRPLQADAMRAALEGRDSLVVLPTGGGKSLCYQAPAVLLGGTTVVISPLIALMKDQVDGLRSLGIPAVALDSTLSSTERHVYEHQLRMGDVPLLFVSPERLMVADSLIRILKQIDVHTFAIDECHCISHWGHDFRPEYRQLASLREQFPDASFHGYTATATQQVRQDIIRQLALREPVVLVGNFDRPNLTFRVLPRQDMYKQVLEVIARHQGEAGIIYCMTQREVNTLAGKLQKQKINALPYHAGLETESRQRTQEAFINERCDIVVATVAFGMGIDRSNVRFVLHTAMPKSLEHYQQEAGRAGRDGLEAECILLYSGADFLRWKSILEKSAQNAADNQLGGIDPAFLPSALKHLDEMDRYARGASCRHRALVEHFGQRYESTTCNACDLCLGDTEEVPDALIVAQKILSCVARVRESFGIGHVIAVLRGQNTEKIRQRGHDQLTTYGLLKEHPEAEIRDWVYQLISQSVLVQAGDDYPLLRLNKASWEVMQGNRDVRLIQLVRRKKGERPQKSVAATIEWQDVDRDLFEALRKVRSELASERQVPPYVIFNDRTLRELAKVKPKSKLDMVQVYGVGEAKLRDFGDRFLVVINPGTGQDPQGPPVGSDTEEEAPGEDLFG